jgi:nucleotide-binding universal stress UspA family protein
MSKKMKLLIGYDGSESADRSLVELTRAGLAQNVEALILVDDVWLPSSPSEYSRAVSARRMLASEIYSFVPALRTLEEGRALSREAVRRARSLFPGWDVTVDVSHSVGSPASELIRRAASWKADLIVIGSDSGHGPQAGFGVGGAFRKIVSEAPCSVRLARTRTRGAAGPVRLLVAGDESTRVMSAIRAIAARKWPEGSEGRFVETDEVMGASADAIDISYEVTTPVGMNDEEYSSAQASAILRSAGLRVSVVTGKGSLHDALIKEAHDWGADCVFVAAHDHESRAGSADSVRLAATLASSSPSSVELLRAVKREPEHGFLPLTRDRLNSSRIGVG